MWDILSVNGLIILEFCGSIETGFWHAFATRIIENGIQPKSLQKILGHGL